MNKNIKLAVAGAVLALGATAANAGIIIPAGDWTLDVNGNVNAFVSTTSADDSNTVTGGVATKRATYGSSNQKSIGTGLLPSWLGFTGKTRQNDLDVEFTISLQPGVSANDISGDGAFAAGGDKMLNRQTYVSFGDKSWGSIKLGKDLGVFASDAILNDMTLLGVGSGAALSGSSANTTNGGIGTGYLYAAWKGQVAYTTPNMNGFQATVAIVNPNQGIDSVTSQSRFGLEGKASYSFSANDVTGKVWMSGLSNRVTAAGTNTEYTADVYDIGANVNVAGFGLTGYYYNGEGVGTTLVHSNGYSASNGKRDSDGGYVQATYILPTKTKLGVAYGISNLDLGANNDATSLVKENGKT
jgi:predicted porin